MPIIWQVHICALSISDSLWRFCPLKFTYYFRDKSCCIVFQVSFDTSSARTIPRYSLIFVSMTHLSSQICAFTWFHITFKSKTVSFVSSLIFGSKLSRARYHDVLFLVLKASFDGVHFEIIKVKYVLQSLLVDPTPWQCRSCRPRLAC